MSSLPQASAPIYHSLRRAQKIELQPIAIIERAIPIYFEKGGLLVRPKNLCPKFTAINITNQSGRLRWRFQVSIEEIVVPQITTL